MKGIVNRITVKGIVLTNRFVFRPFIHRSF